MSGTRTRRVASAALEPDGEPHLLQTHVRAAENVEDDALRSSDGHVQQRGADGRHRALFRAILAAASPDAHHRCPSTPHHRPAGISQPNGQARGAASAPIRAVDELLATPSLQAGPGRCRNGTRGLRELRELGGVATRDTLGGRGVREDGLPVSIPRTGKSLHRDAPWTQVVARYKAREQCWGHSQDPTRVTG